MVVLEPEILSHSELESPLQEADQETKNNAFTTPLGRQSSIYSLTLDEFQNTLCGGGGGKNFGSMNMDEFLNSIWTAEENQAFNNNTPTINAATAGATNSISSNKNANDNSVHLSLSKPPSDDKMIAKQPSLPRQGSLTLPAPLCRKTVDEVWSEIHKSQQGQQQTNNNNVQNSSDSAPRQPTFGEMTLEDFLIRAGVVREQCNVPGPPLPPQQQQYALYHNNNTMGSTFVSRAPAMGVTTGGGGGVATFQTLPPHGGGGVGESSSAYAGNGKQSNNGYPSPSVCFGGRVGAGGGGFGPAQPLGMEAAVSSVSSDGMCTSQVDNAGNQYGLDMGGLRGRKRILDGPVEKVVERRQRRMIKNRESAARSRARKQAYTVELEAELNQLREENTHLKETMAEVERKRKQQYFEEVKIRAPTKAHKAKEKLKVMRRTSSCPL